MAARDYQKRQYAFVDSAWEQDFAANAAPIKLINPDCCADERDAPTLFGGLVDTLVSNLNRKASTRALFCLKSPACSQARRGGSSSLSAPAGLV